MDRFFVINGKRYKAKPFDFNTVCDLEDNGVSLAEMAKKPMSMARAYFSLCYRGTKEDAGKEIQEHVINGGNFTDLYEAMGAEMNESGFFQALNKGEGEEDQKMEKPEQEKK